MREVNEKHEPTEKHETGGKSARQKEAEEVGRDNVRLLPVIYLNLIAGDVAVQRLLASSLSRMQPPSKIMIPVRIYQCVAILVKRY